MRRGHHADGWLERCAACGGAQGLARPAEQDRAELTRWGLMFNGLALLALAGAGGGHHLGSDSIFTSACYTYFFLYLVAFLIAKARLPGDRITGCVGLLHALAILPVGNTVRSRSPRHRSRGRARRERRRGSPAALIANA